MVEIYSFQNDIVNRYMIGNGVKVSEEGRRTFDFIFENLFDFFEIIDLIRNATK